MPHAHVTATLAQTGNHVQVGQSRKGQGHVLTGCAFITHGAGDDDQIARTHELGLHQPRSAYADEGVGADARQFLHGDRGRWPTNAGRGYGDASRRPRCR